MLCHKLIWLSVSEIFACHIINKKTHAYAHPSPAECSYLLGCTDSEFVLN